MDSIGEVVEILGDRYVLIGVSNVNLVAGEIVTVFSRVPNASIEAKYALPAIHIPKGKLSVVAAQGKGLYLAQVFRPTIEREVTVDPAALLTGVFGRTFTRQEQVPGVPSARLSDATIPLKLDEKVLKGDFISR